MYHFDEENGCSFAELLTLKGYTNVKLLTGGIEEYGALYCQDLEGHEVPKLSVPEVRNLTRDQDPRAQAKGIKQRSIHIQKRLHCKNQQRKDRQTKG